MAISAGAVFGGVYKQVHPFDKVWMVALAWLIIGVIVTSLMKGREPASRAIDELHSEATVRE
jgi:hypothetical protein